VKSILVDAGPLIALFDRDDAYHGPVVSFLKQFRGSLVTTWPVITETSHMLSFNVNVQIDFLEWLKKGAVAIVNMGNEHLERIIELSKKYSDVPMDLADSSLMVVAELTGIRDIISIDSDYRIYKTGSGKKLNNVLTEYIEK